MIDGLAIATIGAVMLTFVAGRRLEAANEAVRLRRRSRTEYGRRHPHRALYDSLEELEDRARTAQWALVAMCAATLGLLILLAMAVSA